MTREEQIITEAKKYYSDSINCHNAFLHGVEWADKYPVNVWHDKNEEPQGDGWVLVQFDNDAYDTISLPKFVDVFHDFVEMHNFIRWAYIADLLPKGGEKKINT